MQQTSVAHKFIRDSIIVSLFLVTIMYITSCGSDGATSGGNTNSIDNASLKVIAVTPLDTATNIAITSSLTAVFSAPMSAVTMTNAFITVSDGSKSIDGSVNYNESNNTSTWVPNQNFEYLTTYTVTISKNITDLNSNSPLENYSWKFTTESVPTSIPNTPVGAAIIANNAENKISWSSTNGAESYAIYWSTTPGVTKINYDDKIIPSGNSYTHSMLTNGTDYFYVITAVNTMGESPESAEFYGTPQVSSKNWTTTNVESLGIVGKHTSIDVDLAGFSHISYFDETNGEVKYATNISGGWLTESIGPADDQATELVLDSNGSVNVVYQRKSGDLVHATNSSGRWIFNIIEPALSSDDVSIAVDSKNNSHISYFGPAGGGDLKYATNASGSWQSSVVVDGNISGQNPVYATSLQLDSNDQIHISYYDASSSEIRYATNITGVWENISVDSIGLDANATTSLAIDLDDSVHISYYDALNDDVKYASNSTGNWINEIAVGLSSNVTYSSLVVDTNKASHISYGSDAGFKYTTNKSGSWQSTVIDASASGQYNSLGIGSLHASYFDSKNGDLKYATIALDLSNIEPSGLVVGAGNNKNSVMWNAVSGASSYNVYWSTSGSVSKSTGVVISSDINSLDHTGLTNGTRYYYVVTAIGSNGESKESSMTSSTPGRGLDGIAPSVTNKFPRDNAVGVDVNRSIQISFTEDMDPASLTGDTFILQSGNNTIDALASYNAATRVLTLTPTSPLTRATVYTANLNTNARDIALNRLAINEIWSFTTFQNPPTGLTSVARVDGTVDLSWDAVKGATYYTVKRRTIQGGSVVVVGYSISPNINIVNRGAYYYFVSATTASGFGLDSAEIQVDINSPLPNAPVGLRAQAGNGEVSLTWNSVSVTTTYNVYRSTSSGGPYTLLIAATDRKSYTDSGLTNGVTYFYAVQSLYQNAVSEYSKELSVTPSASVPIAPNLSSVTPGNLWANISWQASAGASRYRVYRAIDSNGTYSVIAELSETNYNNIRLRTATTYYYKIAALNDTGLSAYSNEINVTIIASGSPMAVTLSANPSNGQVSLAWNDAVGATSYHVYRGTVTGVYPTDLGVQTSGYTDPNALVGINYFYVVDSVNSTTTPVARSNEISITPFNTPLPAPANVMGIAGNTQTSLNWSAVAYATDYAVYSALQPGGPYLLQGLTATGRDLSFTQTGLGNGTTIYYVVKARLSGVEGDTSSEVSVTPVSSLPLRPAKISIMAGNASISVTWSLVSGSSSYKIYRRTQGATWAVVGAPTVSPFTDTGLANGKIYYYAVSAVSAAGESAWSAQAEATPVVEAPPPPENITVVAGNAGITLAWDPVKSRENIRYTILRSLTPGGPYENQIQEGLIYASDIHFNQTGLANDTNYYYVIRSRSLSSSAESSISREISVTPSAIHPLRPSTLVVTQGNSELSIAWSLVQNASQYKLYRHTKDIGWSQIGSPIKSPFVDTGLINGMRYSYVVSAVNSAGESVWSVEKSIPPNNTSPPIPSNLTVIPGNTAVTLAWSPIHNVTKYAVYRSINQGGPYEYQASAQIGGSFTQTGLINDTTYYYVVRSSGNSLTNNSAFSNEVSVTPSSTRPARSSQISRHVGNTEMTIAWRAVTGAINYRVYRRTNRDPRWAVISEPSKSPFNDTGLINGINYYYKIAAVNDAGEGALSSYVSGIPLDTRPLSPTNVNAIAGNAAVSGMWYPVANATSYAFFSSTSQGGPYDLQGESSSVGISPSFTQLGLTNNATHYNATLYYVVAAVINGNTGAASQEFVVTPRNYFPNQPTGVTSLAGNAEVSIVWNGVSKADSYRIYRRTDDSAWSMVGTSNLSPFNDKGLTNGVTVYYRVTAIISGNESVLSDQMTGTPVATDPMSPTNVTAIAENTNVNLSWSPVANATDYAIFQSLTQGGPYVFQTIISTGESHIQTGLSDGTTYYYVVSARINGNSGAYSAEVSSTVNIQTSP